MEQRISLITLGVSDLARSTAFFERLGWQRSVRQAKGVSFFQCGSIAVALYPFDDLARDSGESSPVSGSAGFAIAHNGRSKSEVDAVLAEAEAAGALIVKPAAETFWGGYAGYFRDLDGHLWEIAWNPGFPLDDTGTLHLPE